MTRIVLVRHGDVEGISPERFRGRTDVPLTALGLRQADRVAARIAGGWRPAAIYTSPMAVVSIPALRSPRPQPSPERPSTA